MKQIQYIMTTGFIGSTDGDFYLIDSREGETDVRKGNLYKGEVELNRVSLVKHTKNLMEEHERLERKYLCQK